MPIQLRSLPRPWLSRQLGLPLTWSEVSGGLGDLGTLLPILLSLSLAGQVSLSSSLIFGGLWNVLTGVYWGIPVCVQPMKALAAAALAKGLSSEEVSGAGLMVGGILVLLGVSGLVGLVAKWSPKSVVQGLQLGTGLVLASKAAKLLSPLGWWPTSATFHWADNAWWALAAGIFVAFFSTAPGGTRASRVPSALGLFLVGCVFVVIRLATDTEVPEPRWPYPHPQDSIPAPRAPSMEETTHGFLVAGVGQLPLTLLNSVVALVALSGTLFPPARESASSGKKLSIREVTCMVGVMNLIGPWFQAMPTCHGSGGLAAQYRFGARAGGSVVVLGLGKMVLGLLFGTTLLPALTRFPSGFLGVMLFTSGMELAMAAIPWEEEEMDVHLGWTVRLATAGSLIAFSHDGIGHLLFMNMFT
ncbi:hypothetical protein BJ684DRAFT_22877 [Piptocephalis cylindrospora]|uniref:Sulfate transporter family-domain-containing protein n=1 Tax=Piptocephalis cylindrospora TaxID=1907219 RepID=A0A4V1IY30_9FUNG|nr:hypothetical protein BJ684DRAFT_22877 [Piptocephalis cylindrospora]|eukprot:RKP13129.1 hypothetical protein BJ684DRAFT_22877 [Piptocephalis cylindrospora]